MDSPIYNKDYYQKTFHQLENKIRMLENSLESLNPTLYGEGLMSYDSHKQVFVPRVALLSKNRSTEMLESMLYKGSRYSEIESGLNLLQNVANEVFQTLRNLSLVGYKTEENELQSRIALLAKLATEKSEPCLQNLALAYTNRQKDPHKVKQIAHLSRSLFASIHNSNALMNPGVVAREPAKIIPHSQSASNIHAPAAPSEDLPHPEMKVLNETALKIVGAYEANRQMLTTVSYSGTQHPVIPMPIIKACLEEETAKSAVSKHKHNLKGLLNDFNNELKKFNQSAPISAQGGLASWIGLQIKVILGRVEVIKNASTPTSEKSNRPELDNLTNIKVQVDDFDGHMTVTCGMITTKRKADEFVESVKFALEKRALLKIVPTPLQIVLHQLNSKASDPKGTVQFQHSLCYYIEDQLQLLLQDKNYCQTVRINHNGGPIVSHMNTAFNKATALPTEESFSRDNNLVGLSTQVLWVMESTKKMIDENLVKIPNILEKAEHLKQLRAELIKLEKADHPSDKKLSTVQQEIRANLNEIALLSLAASRLHLLSDDNTLRTNSAIIALQNKLGLMAHITALQTKSAKELQLPDLTRNPEIELHLLMDMQMGSLTEMNCKSGIDRTGLARAYWDSLRMLGKKFAEIIRANTQSSDSVIQNIVHKKLYDLIIKQNAMTYELDEIQKEILNERKIKFVYNLEEFKHPEKLTTYPDMLDMIKEKILAKCGGVKSQKYNDLILAMEYQNLIAAHLFSVGQVVTLESSGLVGLKYGQDADSFNGRLGANPHPMGRIPMFLSTAEGHVIQLYDFDTNLRLETWGTEFRRHITPAGAQLLLRGSKWRGD